MARLIAFNSMTLDGYFSGLNGDISWAHGSANDPEFAEFVAENAKGGGRLVFGRVTYDMMVSYWPTPMASKNDPVVAEQMNSRSKIVFSRTLNEASWSNTTLVKSDIVSAMQKLKEGPEDMAILGSGSIVSQLAQAGLIDEFQMVIQPVVLGKGRTMFEGVRERLSLRLIKTRVFKSGSVLVCYGQGERESRSRS